MKAIAWNSLNAPLPTKAMLRLLRRAKTRATSAEVAAVRKAVVIANSLTSVGWPVA